MVTAADRVLALATDKTKIIPGHGPLSNKAELPAYRNMLADVAQRIKDCAAPARAMKRFAPRGPPPATTRAWAVASSSQSVLCE